MAAALQFRFSVVQEAGLKDNESAESAGLDLLH